MMKVLGIETSCDDTAAAVVAEGRRIISSLVASQEAIHAPFGGVVPEVASRQHLLQAIPMVERALRQARLTPRELDGIAVTIGPGLAGSLLVGVNLAKALALTWGLPLVGINHLEAHIYANWLVEGGAPILPFPLLALVVSGGHTELILMRDHGSFRRLGATRDDAAGEAFDKVSRLLGLGYPGGPAIEAAAAGAAPEPRLPRAWLRDSDDFSFSGLKTAVLRLVEGQPRPSRSRGSPPPPSTFGLAAAFQEAVVEVLARKTVAAAERRRVRGIILAGGVAANQALRHALAQMSPLPVLIPPPSLCTDNAAMVATAGYYHLVQGERAPWDLDVQPNLRLG